MKDLTEVYAIPLTDDKGPWPRIGNAALNKDGSLNVYLRALPISGRLQIRKPKTEDLSTPSTGDTE